MFRFGEREGPQGQKLLAQAVETDAGHGYDDLAADALAWLGQESGTEPAEPRSKSPPCLTAAATRCKSSCLYANMRV